MATTAELEARLETITAAFHTGATRVTYDGRTTEFRSIAEMQEVIEKLESEVAASKMSAVPTVRKPKRLLFKTGRGL